MENHPFVNSVAEQPAFVTDRSVVGGGDAAGADEVGVKVGRHLRRHQLGHFHHHY